MPPAPAAPPLALTTPVEAIPGVGPRIATALHRLGIRALAHLIDHLPHRHERIDPESPIAEIREGQTTSARATVERTRIAGRGRNRSRFEAILTDGTGRLDITWFNSVFLQSKIRPGMTIRVQGLVGRRGPSLQMINPIWRPITDEDPTAEAPTSARMRPIYPATEDLSSQSIERIIERTLDAALPLIEDHLPEAMRAERGMPTLADAYRMMHRPADNAEVAQARRRLAYDELLMLQLAVAIRRAHTAHTFAARELPLTDDIDRRIRARLPFDLTPSQNTVTREIAADLARPTPANRLLQGDVGSGKTAVAIYAMLLAAAHGHQSALMAPTELLAEQHHASLRAILESARLRVALLTGSIPRREADDIRASLASGAIDIVIGTHALLTESVTFKSLALAIIDEQHRFGVNQRALLRAKAADNFLPHTIVMTATPIPRTLALTVFGDLDVSTITDLPPGRAPITTRLIRRDQRRDAYIDARAHLERGNQAYVVVPAVDAETSPDLADVRSTVEQLDQGVLAGYRIAGIHGRLDAQTRDHIMGRFRAGLIDVLVATTVIEVGVDVPNATAMIIEHADRFGLAQLHQIRGRIGRGTTPGLCIAISDADSPDTSERLAAFASTTDGFALADIDFRLRGPGDIFSAQQSGSNALRIVSFPQDHKLLLLARKDAQNLVEQAQLLAQPEFAVLRRRLAKRHGTDLTLLDVA